MHTEHTQPMPPEAERRISQLLAHPAQDRGFLSGTLLRRITVEGVGGIGIPVRLTSYRALPLSCIGGIQLSIDGQPQDLTHGRLGLAGAFHTLSQLGALSGVYWFILDIATLFVPGLDKLADGAHVVEGTLCTIEPYITAGRFAFYNSSRRQMEMETSAP